MDLKTFVVDLVDLRPIPIATRYAAGTALSGCGCGLILGTLLVGGISLPWLVVGWLLIGAGSVIAVFAYSALKRSYDIVPRSVYPTEARGLAGDGS